MPNVYVTGIGGTTGLANSLSASLEAMFCNTAEDTCAPTPFTRTTLDWGDKSILAFSERIVSPAPKAMEKLQNRTTQMGGYAALQALKHAELTRNSLKNIRVGVVMGTTVGSSMNNVPFYRDYKNFSEDPTHHPAPSLDAMSTFLNSNPSEAIAEMLEVQGPTQTVVNACASGTDAIGIGMQWIQSDLCDVVLAGGCDALSQVTMNGFNSLMVMDENRCRPFDANRQGLNLGEGAAVLVLESEYHMNARGKQSLAHIAGYASACDAHHLTAPHPEGRGLQTAVEQLLSLPGCSPSEIAFVNVHGTGTQNNDAVESHVMAKMLPHTPFFSSKGATGHTLGAAGAIEAALCILCLHKNMIPATIGFKTPDPRLTAHPVQKNTSTSGCTALSTSLAFGGLASALALQIGSK